MVFCAFLFINKEERKLFELKKEIYMNIIITGASKGIGYETALCFAQTGNHKIIGIARNGAALKVMERKFPSSVFKGIEFDLTNIFTNGDELISEIKLFVPEVDILINNAGALINKAFNDYSLIEIENLFKVNVYAPAELIKQLNPMMGINQKAHVVNIGSMAGFQGSSKFPGISWYSVSKAAISCLTESLASEFKSKNISFNCLALGAVQTDMLAEAFPGYKALVTPTEMGKYIANFALTAQYTMNGAVVAVNMSNP
jgi:3-oxoacyl-[acyl-carrier protein] reductase